MQATLKILRRAPLFTGVLKRPLSHINTSPLLVANPIFNSIPGFFITSPHIEKNKTSDLEKKTSIQFEEINNTLLKADLVDLAEFKMISITEVKDCISNIVNQQTTNYTPDELKKISAGLCRQYATTVVETEGKLEMAVLRNLFHLSKEGLLSRVELFYAVYKILKGSSSTKKLTIEEVTSLSFLLHELFRNHRLKKSSSAERDKLVYILNRLQYNLEALLGEDLVTENEKLQFLPKIFFCHLILGNQDQSFLIKIVGRIYSADLGKLEESDLVNLFYIMISTEKKIRTITTDGKLLENHSGLYQRVENMITKRVSDSTLSHSSIPFLLFCYSLTNRNSNKICYIIMKSVVDNIQKFNATEISTILYAMFRMPEIDPNNEILVLILSMFYNKENLENFTGMNLFATLLGLRKPFQDTSNPKHKELFKSLIFRIQKQFEDNFKQLEIESRLRIIYEFAQIHKLVTKENYIKYYRKFVESIDLSKINSQDLLTIGSIQKKYLVFDQESYEFWENYLDHLSRGKFENENEAKRAFSIVKHLMSILDFDMLVNEKGGLDAKVRTQWYEMVHSHYKKITSN